MAGSAWTNQVQNEVIVGGPGGVYIYSGPPAFGNLLYSTATAPDPFGNAVVAGFAAYTAGVLAVALQSGNITVHTAPGPGGPWTLVGTEISLNTGGISLFGKVTATSGTASAPTLVTSDTWHDMTLLNSWVKTNSNFYARYQLMADGSVWIQGRIANGTTAGGTSIWTPPPNYVPTITPNQSIPVTVENTAGAATADSPRLDVSSAGAVLQNVASSTVISFNGRYSLT